MRTIWQLVISTLNACLWALVACHVLNIVRYNLTGVAVPYDTVTYVALFLGLGLGMVFPKFFSKWIAFPFI